MKPFFALPALVLVMACATKPDSIPRPAHPIQVRVDSLPAQAEVRLKGTLVGPTPQALTVDGPDGLLALDAVLPDGTPLVEKRIRFLSLTEAEVSFRFGEGRSAMAKVLGIPRILVFDYGAGVTFDTNKSDLKAAFLPLLERQADMLTTHFKDLDIYVCGHTDSQGSQDFNLVLSLDRSQSVARDLASRGVNKARLKTQGFGSQYPVAGNETESGRSLNRRTEVILPQ